MRVRDLAPDQLAKIVKQYLQEASPDTRKRAIPLIKDAVAEYEETGDNE